MLLSDLRAAFMLLTRLPVGRLAGSGEPTDLARAVWAFPLVGLAVGALGGLAYWVGHRLGLSPPLAAIWTVAAMLLATGAFHEDGLADVADGFGGGRTVERKLEIMRDSRIGAYGTLALILSLMLRVVTLSTLATPGLVVAGLIAAGMIGRGGIVVLLLMLSPARSDGMASSMAALPRWSSVVALALTGAAPFLLFPAKFAVVSVLIGLLVCFGLARVARSQIGGHTGDVLGAGVVAVECVVLTALAALYG